MAAMPRVAAEVQPVEGVQEAPPPIDLERILSASTMKEWWSLLSKSLGPELSQLHWDILSFCKAHELTPHQIQLRKDAVACVERAVHEIWPIAETHLFGSTATGLALPSSDIDLVIMPPKDLGSAWRNPTPMSWQNALSSKLNGLGQCRSFKKIPFAKVPILKMVFNSGIACDISFDARNSHAGVSMIRHFVEQYESCRPLCLVLKFFLRGNNLNDLHIGGLSSFCVITMVISHLQKTASIAEAGRGDLGTLLLSFLAYYSNIHSYRTEVVSTRSDFCGSKEDKGWVSQKNPQLLAVEDPLDPTSDIAKGSYRIEQVRNKFSVAQRALLTNWHKEHVLAPIVGTTSNQNETPAAPSPEKSKKSKRGGRKKHRTASRQDEYILSQQPALKIPRRHHAPQGSGLVTRSQLNRIIKNIGGPTEEDRLMQSGHSHLTQEGLDVPVIRRNQDERILGDFWESHLATRSKPTKSSLTLSSVGVTDLRAQAELSDRLPQRISKIQPSVQDEKLLRHRGAGGDNEQAAERGQCGSQILSKIQEVKSVDENVEIWEAQLPPRLKAGNCSSKQLCAGCEYEDTQPEQKSHLEHHPPTQCSAVLERSPDERKLVDFWETYLNPKPESKKGPWNDQQTPRAGDEGPEVCQDERKLVDFWETHLNPKPTSARAPWDDHQAPPAGDEGLEMCLDETKLVDFWETHLNPKPNSKKGPWNDQQAPGAGDERLDMCLDERKLVDFWETHLNPKPTSARAPWDDHQAPGAGVEGLEMCLDERKLVEFWETHLNPTTKSKKGPWNDQQAAEGANEGERAEKCKDHGYDRILVDFWEANLAGSRKSRKCALIHDTMAGEEDISPVQKHHQELTTQGSPLAGRSEEEAILSNFWEVCLNPAISRKCYLRRKSTAVV